MLLLYHFKIEKKVVFCEKGTVVHNFRKAAYNVKTCNAENEFERVYRRKSDIDCKIYH